MDMTMDFESFFLAENLGLLGLLVMLLVWLTGLYVVIRFLRSSKIPGPQLPSDPSGNLPDIVASGGIHNYLFKLHSEYGEIAAFWYGQEYCVSVSSPDSLKQLASPFNRPKCLFNVFEPLMMKHSIQFANGDNARMRHAAYTQCYSDSFHDAYFPDVLAVAQMTRAKLAKAGVDDQLQLTDTMTSYAISAILTTSFGHYFKDDGKVLAFKKSYEYVWSHMENKLSGETESQEAEERFKQERDKLLDLLREASAEAKTNPAEASHHRLVDVVSQLDISEDTRLADMLSMCIGGTWGTGYLLTWAVYYICSNPEVEERLFQEIQDVVESEELDYKTIAKLTYMRQVLNETLRCSKLAPFTARIQEQLQQIRGYIIPAGANIIHALGVIFSDPDLWPNPETFDPDRFPSAEDKPPASLNARRTSITDNSLPFVFEPFGFAGNRKCPGHRFVYVEAIVMLCSLIRKFKIRLVPGQTVEKVHCLVTRPKEEIWFTVEKRE